MATKSIAIGGHQARNKAGASSHRSVPVVENGRQKTPRIHKSADQLLIEYWQQLRKERRKRKTV
jgi:hypothetical protein